MSSILSTVYVGVFFITRSFSSMRSMIYLRSLFFYYFFVTCSGEVGFRIFPDPNMQPYHTLLNLFIIQYPFFNISAADKCMQHANFQQRFFWSDFCLHCIHNSVVLVEQDLIFFLYQFWYINSVWRPQRFFSDFILIFENSH